MHLLQTLFDSARLACEIEIGDTYHSLILMVRLVDLLSLVAILARFTGGVANGPKTQRVPVGDVQQLLRIR